MKNARIAPSILSQDALDSLNGVHASIANKTKLRELGGINGLISKLGVNPKTGLTDSQLELMFVNYGDNSM